MENFSFKASLNGKEYTDVKSFQKALSQLMTTNEEKKPQGKGVEPQPVMVAKTLKSQEELMQQYFDNWKRELSIELPKDFYIEGQLHDSSLNVERLNWLVDAIQEKYDTQYQNIQDSEFVESEIAKLRSIVEELQKQNQTTITTINGEIAKANEVIQANKAKMQEKQEALQKIVDEETKAIEAMEKESLDALRSKEKNTFYSNCYDVIDQYYKYITQELA